MNPPPRLTLLVLLGVWAVVGCSANEGSRSGGGGGGGRGPAGGDGDGAGGDTADCVVDADCPSISVWDPSCDGQTLQTPTETGPLGCVDGRCNPGFALVDTDCSTDGGSCGPDPDPDVIGDRCVPPHDPFSDHDEATLTLEVMVGSDSAMSAAYGQGLTAYVADVMSQVHYMFANLAPAVDLNVVMVRHEVDVDLRGLALSTDQDELLGNWIAWSRELNVDDDSDPAHFDYSFLLTKTAFGTGWALTGVPICDEAAGSIVYDKGYISAKVIAHETGHSFGLGHREGRQNIMHVNPGTAWHADTVSFFEQLDVETEPCLADFVRRTEYSGVPAISLDDQCGSTFGETVCTQFGAPTQCDKLMCEVDEWNCNWDDSPVLDGSPCGDDMWCIGGLCVEGPQL